MRYLIMLLCIIAVIFYPRPYSHGNLIQEKVYQRLDEIREEKKQQLLDYLKRIRNNAYAIKSDSAMINFFHIKRKFYQLQKTTHPPEALVHELEKLKKGIVKNYIHKYLAFYDILFVDKNGDIFYTIRKQSDYHKNIFHGKLAETNLSRKLKKVPHQVFVDYQYYSASDEPSAFLTVPVMKEESVVGWFVFQCAINKINSIFEQKEELGATGEVFLVNKQNFMLTDSRFYGESSILKKHLSHKNIVSKFKEKAGQKIVADYRGFKVLSSFEVCHVANSEWLLISKIDEDEIITEQYKKNRQELRPLIIKRFNEEKPKYCDLMPASRETIVVDMDEFRKVNNKEMISTFGISTCTAVIVSLPEKFTYMTHISNLDSVYGGHTTDLIGNIIKRIKTFDIYKHEIRDLRITVVANHFETIINIIDKLVDQGIFLSQIKFMHNSKAKYANLLHDYINNQTLAGWVMDDNTGNVLRQRISDVDTIDCLIKPIIGYR